MTGAAPGKSRTGAGRRTWWPQLGCDGSPETAIVRATIACCQTPIRRRHCASAELTPTRHHEERHEVRGGRLHVSRALVVPSARFRRLGPRRHFRTHTRGLKNGSKQRSRPTGVPQGLVAAVAAPRPICEAFLSTMITAATASRPVLVHFGWARAKKCASESAQNLIRVLEHLPLCKTGRSSHKVARTRR